MNHPSFIRVLTAGVVGAAMLLLSAASLADPPARVARLSEFSGPVSFSPAGEDEWVLATPNRPLVTGDRLWADAGARVELQAGSVALRLGGSTSANILNLDDNATQIELTQGSLYVRAWRVDRGGILEIDTPNLAFTISSAGRYRIDVDPEGNVTTLAVLAGQGEAYGEGAAYRIGAGDRYSFSGTGLRDYQYTDIAPPDEFERWAADRDSRYESSVSARYVSRDVIGYQDLDQYGSWSVVASYGNVWYPRSVPSGWAPYRTGHWSWIDPWGWTWVDEAPWGFAPYHYGRWAYLSNRWGWIPGPVSVRPVYAPALVAFIGGGDLRLSLSVGGASPGVAWFPLGPGEVYRPSYHVSRNYFNNVNVSNTRVTNVNITNVYNSYTTNTNVTNVTYRNRQAPGGVTAVPVAAFVQAQPVARAAVRLSPDALAREPATAVAQVAPTRASLVGASAAAGAAAAGKPPERALRRDVVARTKPPAAAPPFASRQAALAANPGRPLEAAAAARIKPGPASAEPQRNVKVVAPTQAAAPPKGEGRDARRSAAQPADGGAAAKGPQGPAAAPAPGAAARSEAPPQGRQAAPKGREAGRQTLEGGKAAAAQEAPQAGPAAAPVPRPAQERVRANNPGQQKSAPTESAQAGKNAPQGEPASVPRPPQGQRARSPEEVRQPPTAGGDQRRVDGAQAPPPQAPSRPPATRREPAPQPAPEAQQRRQDQPPRSAPPPPPAPETRREAAPPPPATPAAQPRPEPRREAAPPPPPTPAAQPRPQPRREAPKADPKRDEGKGGNQDKGQKDKDQKDKEEQKRG
ncbi:MAG: DUF6600 domain-containing protein [Burkholderiales bacterium]